ncbi:alpha/beta fold hydrolase [Sphingomonas sp. AR_OL41]|uniref:alpha/beta fold hydrolase n=1 Tax=Sphingomonas sp. AR_OL41 TaxID=3042729 RepID=UPI00248117CD|nr:alpha/beta fold hydrolase [Sphingomonas sp. AR_OL41]MDH7975116.1 alpha/beta fold hydrolase [Sphingomonas sp. AR_OL41]
MTVTMPKVADLPPPSKLLWAAELPRAAWTMARYGMLRARSDDAPRGDGRPVMVLPGLFTTDRSNFALRQYLRALGYAAQGWELGRNLGTRTVGDEGERLFARIEAMHAEHQAPVTLVGVSLGGMLARLAAQRMPDKVREVITVNSPFAGDPRSTNVWRAYEWLTGEKVTSDSIRERAAEIAAPLPMPSTAIWSASDGLVNGLICYAADDPQCRNIEVRSSHMGVQLNPDVLRIVADILGNS